MPIPVYIICSKGASCDRTTGKYSIFEVVEKLVVVDLPKPKTGDILYVEQESFVVTSTWMIDTKNNESFEDEFDFNIRAYMDGGDTLLEKDLSFKFLPDLPLYRYTINMLGQLHLNIKNSGTLLVECRVRKQGANSWKQQTYRVLVEKQKLE